MISFNLIGKSFWHAITHYKLMIINVSMSVLEIAKEIIVHGLKTSAFCIVAIVNVIQHLKEQPITKQSSSCSLT